MITCFGVGNSNVGNSKNSIHYLVDAFVVLFSMQSHAHILDAVLLCAMHSYSLKTKGRITSFYVCNMNYAIFLGILNKPCILLRLNTLQVIYSGNSSNKNHNITSILTNTITITIKFRSLKKNNNA